MMKTVIISNIYDIAVNFWGMLASWLSLRPLVVRIRITNRCNLSCHYCYVGDSLNKKNDNLLKESEWINFFENLPKKTLIDITGGEPFLTPNIYQILNSALERKLKVAMISNGTVKNDQLLDLIVRKQLMYFMVSFDGDRALHDEIRGQGAFNKSIETVTKIIELKKKYKSKYPILVAKVTYTEKNYKFLNAEIAQFRNLGFDRVTLNLLFSNEARNGFVDAQSVEDKKFKTGNQVSFSSLHAKEMGKEIKKIMVDHGVYVEVKPKISISKIEKYFESPKNFYPESCHKDNSILTMYSDGTLAPCDLGLNLGNIRNHNYQLPVLNDLVSYKAFKKIFKQSKNPACQGCCLKEHIYES